MTHTFVEDVSHRYRGHAAVYRVEPPVRYFDNDYRLCESEYVVASAVSNPLDTSIPETLLFPSSEDGSILIWSELPGSYRGGMDHEEALRGLDHQPVPEHLEEDEAWSWVDEGE